MRTDASPNMVGTTTGSTTSCSYVCKIAAAADGGVLDDDDGAAGARTGDVCLDFVAAAEKASCALDGPRVECLKGGGEGGEWGEGGGGDE